MQRTTMIQEEGWKPDGRGHVGKCVPQDRMLPRCAPRSISCAGRWLAVRSSTRHAAW